MTHQSILRRGACPGLSAPMPTGDGLLVRLLPIDTVPLAAFAELCAAARTYGNGVVEITARGSIQVRGLTAGSAPSFAAAVGATGIAAQDGVPILADPLAGLAADEILDATRLAADLRRALTQQAFADRLAPKVSLTIDGGGALNLDAVAADIRLRAETGHNGAVFRISAGGDAASAVELGVVSPTNAIEAALQLLEVIARGGGDVRARDIIVAQQSELHAAIADLLEPSGPRLRGNERAAPIGTHPLRDGAFARGIELAFGHADAAALISLVGAAEAAGAIGMRTAPGRALIAIGLNDGTVRAFGVAAERLGFIVRADDLRRRVIACAGAPVCTSAYIAARAVAPLLAQSVGAERDRAFKLHVSGCAKGCAHPAPASLTIVGTPDGCGLIVNGSARDAPFAYVALDNLPTAIARHLDDARHEASHV